MKRLFAYLLLLAAFLTLTSGALPAHAQEDWQIDAFSSRIFIQPNGDVLINEGVVADFRQLEKHGILRDIPYVYEDAQGKKTYTEITIEMVTMDDTVVPFETEKNSTHMRIKIGDPEKTVRGMHRYDIQYVVKGVLRSYDGYDELYWNVTGNDWPVEIKRASALVSLPQEGIVQQACYKGPQGATNFCTATQTSSVAEFYTRNTLSPSHGMTIALGYTKGMVPILTVAPPTPLVDQIQWGWLIGSLLSTIALGSYLLWRRWSQHGRDAWYGHHANTDNQERKMAWGEKEVIAPEFAAPHNLRPAELGTLVDERADTLDVTATIVDLAVRGFLTITEEDKKWVFGSKDYILKQQKTANKELLKYEQLLLGSLFATGTEVRLSELKNSFYDDLAKVKQALYKEVVDKKFFAKNPEHIRNVHYGTGAAIIVIAAVAIVGTLVTGAVWALWFAVSLGFMIGMVIVGFTVLATAHTMPARTAEGRHLYRQALGYKLFIGKVEKYRAQFMEKENMFETVLPYAIVFGVTGELAKAMKVLELQPTSLGWYHGIHPFTPTAFAKDLNTFSTTLSTAMASSPQSSGSGGSGFSGGGFGGGGGGSW